MPPTLAGVKQEPYGSRIIIEVKWTIPYNSRLMSYDSKVCSPEGCSTKKLGSSSTSVAFAVPCYVDVKISVAAVYGWQGTRREAILFLGRSSVGPPSEPRISTVSFQNNDLTVTWRPPRFPGGPSVGYHVRISQDDRELGRREIRYRSKSSDRTERRSKISSTNEESP